MGDFPYADFVVLVGGEEFVGVDNDGLDGTLSGGNNVGGWLMLGVEIGVVP